MSFAASIRTHLSNEEEIEIALATSLAESKALMDDKKPDTSVDEAIARSLAESFEEAPKGKLMEPKKSDLKKLTDAKKHQQYKMDIPAHRDLRKEVHHLHDAKWVVTTGYPDGSAVVNATYVWQAGRNPVEDIKAGCIIGQAPYCFLITLFHMNRTFFDQRGINSPYALSTYLTRAGLPPKEGVMYNDETIAPVARHFRATIYMNIVDAPDHSYPVNDDGKNEVFLVVHLALQNHHYISGTEF